MQIYFIGETIFSQFLFFEIMNMVEIVGVTTSKESGSDSFDLTYPGIPHNYILDPHFIRLRQPTYIFCCGWHSIINPEILQIAPVIGYHPSPLPVGRGCSPIIWAIAKGLEETASTFFWMDTGIDTGKILSQIPVSIAKGMSAKQLYLKLMGVAGQQLKSIIKYLQGGYAPSIPQDNSKATYWPKREKGENKWLEYW